MVDVPANKRAAVQTEQRKRDAQQLARLGASPAALRIARKLRFGTVRINTRIPFVNEMPHGGYTQSGYGRDMGIYSLAEYTQFKQVMAAHD
ncbi:MAG TPA: aldehyde dehydrogenase family protein [Ktedonobacterales bacterium]|nr:aldehyde dehydrogenase family protein [Ktedonobacterales bacterium]